MATITRPLDEAGARAAAATSQRLDELLAASQDLRDVDRFVLRSESDERSITVDVPVGALEVLRDLLVEMGKGNSVTVVPVNAELTTQEAADLLNVSRPFVVGLVEKGQLPARKVGKHRRIRVEDVMDYKNRDDERRGNIADELARGAQDMDGPDNIHR